MTPTLLRKAGEALYGPHWQTFLARDLGVAPRTMRRWAAGTQPPKAVAGSIRDLLQRRRDVIAGVEMDLARL